MRYTGQQGFALVIALSLMAFVLLLLLSMTTLVRVESHSAQTGRTQLEAEQAAVLSLNIAIGKLQETVGPDQRVTANASIRDANLNQAHLVGVWKSFKQSNLDSTPINYDAQKQADFVQWLSSTNDDNQEDPTYPGNPPINSVEMVGSGSVTTPLTASDPSGFIYAEAIDFDVGAAPGSIGKYAWHVFDESQKSNLTLNKGDQTTNAQRVSSLGIGGKPGFQIDPEYQNLEILSDADRDKLIHLESSSVVSFDPVINNAFHYLSTGSKGLLVDVANGGLQKDLSLLFADTTLPATYVDRHIYSESDTPIAPEPTRFTGSEPMPSPDPKWSLLRSHHNLYQQVSDSSGAFGVDASYVERDGSTEYFDEQQLLPVVSNAQFIFSMAPQRHNLTDPYVGFLGFWTDVVVTLWNPYDVELRVPNMEFEFYRFPLQVEFFRRELDGSWGSASSGNPVHIAYMFNKGNNKTGVFNIQDRLPYRARIDNSFVLKPGEYKVFCPNSQTYNHRNWNYTKGLRLIEGWDPQKGGIFERYISTNATYNAQCEWPGPGRRQQIQLRMDDEISVEVSPAKVNRTTSFEETNDKEIVAYLKVFQGDGGEVSDTMSSLDAFETALDANRVQVGAIEIDYTNLDDYLPTYGKDEMSQMVVTTDNLLPQGDSTRKVPFLIASLRLKTEQDSDGLHEEPNGSMWLHNGITNQYFTTGLDGDQQEHEKTHQYELTWEPMTSWNNIPTVEIGDQDRGFGGSGVTSASGVEYAPFHQVPLVPATSIAQFSHAPLNAGGQAPLTTQIVGNSSPSPLMSQDQKTSTGSLGTHLDHSYLANNTLFDAYFLSTAADENNNPLITTSARDLNMVVSDFFSQEEPLPNINFEPVANTPSSVTPADYDTFAQYLYNKGAFNVNSTSEEAWALFLASGTKEALPILDVLTAGSALGSTIASTDTPVSRFAPLIGDEVDASINDQDRWAGHRRLDADQIIALAEYVVAEVRERGPFQSVAEFVNRQLAPAGTPTADAGALQSAIDQAALNTDHGLAAPKNKTELDADTATGSTSDGAATQITQADLLNRLAPSLTVRGDTFRIRSYGEITRGGNTIKVWCEAVVQREHDFVDDSQVSTTDMSSLNPINETFGRRFKIVSFRWLSPAEV